MRTLLGVAALGAALALPSPAAAARTFWVSPAGSDSAAGTRSEPFRTLARALAASSGGQTIRLAPGRYPSAGPGRNWSDTRMRRRTVRVIGAGPFRTVLGRFRFHGATRVRMERLSFGGTLEIVGSRNIVVRRSEFSGKWAPEGLNPAILIRQGARNVTVAGNWIHHAGSGITGPPSPLASSGIRVAGNVMEDLWIDGMQFASWTDATIEGNVIRRLHHPTGHLHNDGMQVIGNVARLRIARNTISQSRHQGMLISSERGPIHDVTIESNVVERTAAIPMYVLGVTGLRIVGNTVWRSPGSRSGGAIALRNADNSQTPSDAIIANNIASQIATWMPVAVRDWNLVGSRGVQYGVPSPHEIFGVDPLFADAALRPSADSPARSAGNPAFGGALDRDGRPRGNPPAIGAYEASER